MIVVRKLTLTALLCLLMAGPTMAQFIAISGSPTNVSYYYAN
jgi:hypothetical protein